MQIATGIDVAAILGFIGLLVLVWNMSRRFTTLENDAKTGKEQHNNDVKSLKEDVNKLEKELIQRISDTKVEQKEEIQKTVGNNFDRFENLQKQIDGSRSDLKDVSTRVTTVNTKTEYIEKEIGELKQCDAANHRFFTDWNQRIEDRIEEARNEIGKLRSEFVNMFTAFHSGKRGNNSNGNHN